MANERALHEYLTELVDVLSLGVGPVPEARPFGQAVYSALRARSRQPDAMPDGAFAALLHTAVYEPNPSANRWPVEAALNAFGRRRVRQALLDRLRNGTNVERGGAALAWYWSALPIRYPHLMSGVPADARATADESADIVEAWRTAALQEFVDNEDPRVRHCIIPGLPLARTAYLPEFHVLVDDAVAIARTHPDSYIRHRVEIQVHVT
ncbi:hypothetical protein GCM10023205_45560 [Yinghuangia aomiensis]|uniref:Uncharacterized protein n=1 Tax=Yinghuangia aomiensis TaxID=676205 RepID=A0ABP9HM17_9ACTN